jgi:hypothetical protein
VDIISIVLFFRTPKVSEFPIVKNQNLLSKMR